MNKQISTPATMLVSFFCVLLLSACSVSTPAVTYYSLLNTDTSEMAEITNKHLILAVGPVTLPETLKTSRIVTGGKDGIFTRSEYHRWSGEIDRDFADALTEQLVHDLGTERIFVYPGNGQIEPNCQILIDILALDGDLGKEAKMNLRWTLIDLTGKNEPVYGQSHSSAKSEGTGYTAWVKAQRNNLSHVGKEIAAAIKAHFEI